MLVFKLVYVFVCFYRPIVPKQKVLKTLQIMLARLFIKAKERAKGKVKMQGKNNFKN